MEPLVDLVTAHAAHGQQHHGDHHRDHRRQRPARPAPGPAATASPGVLPFPESRDKPVASGRVVPLGRRPFVAGPLSPAPPPSPAFPEPPPPATLPPPP